MAKPESVVRFRVRYSETDQMGTYASGRVLEWFECGRTELLREIGTPYAEMEARGVLLPVVEAHVAYRGRAQYDTPLKMTTTATMCGKARVRCEVQIVQAETGAGVAEGYTVHAFTDPAGKAMRPPAWFVEALNGAAED